MSRQDEEVGGSICTNKMKNEEMGGKDKQPRTIARTQEERLNWDNVQKKDNIGKKLSSNKKGLKKEGKNCIR